MNLFNAVVKEIVNPIISLLFVAAAVVFIWGVIGFISGADNEQKRNDGKRHMLWGIIGLAVMLSSWGIIKLLRSFWEQI